MTDFFNVPSALLSKTFLQFDVIYFEILKASLNKPNKML